jgi:DNA replication protein DnaC
MSNEIIKKPQICKGCGNEYEAHIGVVLGKPFEFGKGYCQNCCQKKYDEEERNETEEKLKAIKNTKELWRKSCGIPIRYQDSKFTNFNTNVHRSIMAVYRECQEYASKFDFHNPRSSKSMVIHSTGVWGVGKTHLVCAMANSILDKWNNDVVSCPIHFVSEPSLFLRIRATYNKHIDGENKETEESIYRKLTTVSLLILDDVGKEEVSDPRFVQRVLFAVIDGRYQNMLPIIITANLNPDEMDNHLGGDRGNSASMDRLAEMTGNVFWEMQGKTYRVISNRSP